MANGPMMRVFAEIVARNRVRDGRVYLQVTRGAAPRDFALPAADLPATFVVLARALDLDKIAAKSKIGIAVKVMPDPRWARCDLKTIMLLPSVLSKDAAKAEGAGEAWYVDKAGFVTEGASSNAWIITRAGELITRQAGTEILAGVTRATMKDVAQTLQLRVVERAFTLAEAYGAQEAFLTSASTIVMPVVKIDQRLIGDGKPGPISQRLRAAFHEAAEVTLL